MRHKTADPRRDTMQPDLFQSMLEAIAAAYEAEADPQGPHTAQTLMVTPSPVALDHRRNQGSRSRTARPQASMSASWRKMATIPSFLARFPLFSR